MIKKIYEWLCSLEFRKTEPSGKHYRIVHDPELGYMPEVYDSEYGCWYILCNDLTISGGHSSARDSLYHKYWRATEEEAGGAINRYAQNCGQTIAWRG